MAGQLVSTREWSGCAYDLPDSLDFSLLQTWFPHTDYFHKEVKNNVVALSQDQDTRHERSKHRSRSGCTD